LPICLIQKSLPRSFVNLRKGEEGKKPKKKKEKKTKIAGTLKDGSKLQDEQKNDKRPKKARPRAKPRSNLIQKEGKERKK